MCSLTCARLTIGHTAFDNEPWILDLVEFVQRALQSSHIKVIGVCFGHQIVGRALGCPVVRNDSGGWEVSVCQVQQSAPGQNLYGDKSNLVRAHPTGILLML